MFLDRRLANSPQWFMEKPKDWDMRIPEILRRDVVFLGRAVQKGFEESIYFVGTGFLVAAPLSADPSTLYLYLVTAKHVADQLSLGNWVMRINTKNAGFIDVRGSKESRWWFHPSEESTVDVAVRPFQYVPNLDLTALPVSMFLREEDVSEYGIGAGDDVFLVGLFNRMRGRSRNQPIVRTGNVAMIPDRGELVPGIKMGIDASGADRIVEAEVYLIEARSIGGISGSPVFVRKTIEWDITSGVPPWLATVAQGERRTILCQGPGEYHLMGLINGHWDIGPEYINDLPADKRDKVNLGIAVVVPAKKIVETLNHPELVELRNATDRERQAEQSTTPDQNLVG